VVSIGQAISASPQDDKEIKMSNLKNPAGESGSFNRFTLAIAAIAICVTSAAVLLMPGVATSQVSVTTAYFAGPTGYFPDQFVNQAKTIEPMPEMYY
jgi:hypothetical protein